MIDIIIPAYNARKTLDRALASIVMQQRDDLRVTIADDASDESYEDITARYPIRINIVRSEVNGGPGAARQYAIDRTDGKFMMFLDADDTLYGSDAVSVLMRHMQAGCVAVFGSFREELPRGAVKIHEADGTWMHGKLYRRSHWTENGIRFHPTSRSNEDNGVNSIVRLTAAKAGGYVTVIPDVVYAWQYSDGTITRKDDCIYYFDASYAGYVENKLYAFSEAERIMGRVTDEMALEAVSVMIYLYCYWLETEDLHPELAEKNLAATAAYYREVYSRHRARIPKEDFAAMYHVQIEEMYRRFPNIVHRHTIEQFLNVLAEVGGGEHGTEETKGQAVHV